MNDDIFSSLADSVNSAVSRRKFMQLSGIGAGTILGGSLLGKLQAMAAPPIGPTDGVLVIIYLGGGNDVLNTVAPYSSSAYRTLRPDLYLSPDSTNAQRKCLAIDSNYGFNAAMPSVKAMYDQGKVAVIPGLGFAAQDLSHFTSSAAYMSGWAPTDRTSTGWAGRFLDTLPDANQESTRGITINGSMPLTLQGAISVPISLPTDISDAYNGNTTDDQNKYCEAQVGYTGYASGTVLNNISRGLVETVSLPAKYKTAYPDLTLFANASDFQKQLAIAAGVINANVGARVIHITLGGFDTHTNQLREQADQLATLDAGINTFFQSISTTFANRVSLMTYSEFGRRAQQNGSGTDHGRAAMSLLIGNRVKGGIASPFPSLTDLDSSGNLKNTVDFRQVYAEISSSWLRADKQQIVGATYADLGLFSAGPGEAPTTTTTTTTTTTPTWLWLHGDKGSKKTADVVPEPTTTKTTATTAPTPQMMKSTSKTMQPTSSRPTKTVRPARVPQPTTEPDTPPSDPLIQFIRKVITGNRRR